jgi:hypothetical protein
VLTVGVRVTLQLRRTGRTGLVGIRSRPGSLGWIGELAEGAGLALGVAAPALALGDSYAAYARRAGRFLPRLGRLVTK